MMNAISLFSFFFCIFLGRASTFSRGRGRVLFCISFSENTFCVLITVDPLDGEKEEEEEKNVRELISILFLQILLTCRID